MKAKTPVQLPQAWFTLDDAAETLGLERTSVYEKARYGSIPSAKVGGQVMIPAWYLEKMRDEGLTEPAAA